MKNKRKYIWAGAILLLCFAALAGMAMQKRSSTPVSQETFLFDTVLSISIYDSAGKDPLDSVFEQVFNRSREIESEFSVFQEDSTAEKINRKAAEGAVDINEDFSKVLKTAMQVSELSQGAFDITVKPLSDLWNFNSSAPTVPSSEKIKQALEKVDYQSIVLSDRSIRFQSADTQVEFGAVAKGYAVQEAANQLRDLGIQKAIVNYGGNVALVGEKETGKGFTVGIQTPFASTGEYFVLLQLSDCALATSGAYERNFTIDGILYHHILNPATGYPADSGLKSVTVVCKDAAEADALSTAFFVLGLDRSMEILSSLEGVEAIFVNNQNTIFVTDGLKDKITVTDQNYYLEQEG